MFYIVEDERFPAPKELRDRTERVSNGLECVQYFTLTLLYSVIVSYIHTYLHISGKCIVYSSRCNVNVCMCGKVPKYAYSTYCLGHNLECLFSLKRAK